MRRGLLFLMYLIAVAGQQVSVAVPARAEAPVTSASGPAVEEATLDGIVVTGEKIVRPTRETDETVYTGQEVTKKGMEIGGSKADVGVYEAIDILPGINVESADPYGLAAEQKNIRVRGVRGYLGAMTVEGVPNYGGNPIGPRDYLYDTETIQGIAVYKGAVPADLGTGVGARGGAIELRPRWPEEHFGVDVSQAGGMNEYHRTFLRVDSGAVPAVDTRFSLSYSYTDASKWKGPGDVGPRHNTNFMIDQPITARDNMKLWFNFNDIRQDLYRPLVYSEVRDLGGNYEKDYNSSLTGRRSQDIYYYKHNRADLTNTDVFSIIPFTLNETFSLNFKPYYSLEDSTVMNGSTSQGGLVQRRNRDIERYGLISEVESRFPLLKASLGYWVESSDMKIYMENFDPVTFAYRGYANYAENDGNGILHSPYLKLAGSVFGFNWQAGVKYFYYKDPAGVGYVWNSTAGRLDRAGDLDRESKEYSEFLPSVGLSYNILDSLQVYASYGRNQIRPYSYQPIVNLYNQNRSAFQRAGVTLNDLFNGYGMETSNSYELGARYRHEWFELVPVVFYSEHGDLLTTVYDPRVRLNYQQNIGDATGYGFELDSSVFIGDNLTLFFNPSYSILRYDDNITYLGNTLNTKDRQVVDTPKWLIKTGLVYKYRDFEISPVFKYVGNRFGDPEHREEVGGYFLADLVMSYTFKDVLEANALKISLELYNLFDREYVSVINSSDDTLSGSTSYLVGAPFTGLVKLSMDF